MKRVLCKKSVLVYVIILLITFAVEICIFNLSPLRSVGNTPIDITNQFVISEEAVLNPQTGKYVIQGEEFAIYASNVNAEVENIYFNVSFDDSIVDYKITLSDEGNSKEYRLATQTILNDLDDTKYITIHPYGDVKTLKISFEVAEGTEFALGNIIINANQPINIRWIRVASIFTLLAILSFTRKDCLIHHVPFTPGNKKQLLIGAMICAICLGLTWLIWSSNCTHWRINACRNYDDLTYALANGQFHLLPNVDPRIIELENPYDYYAREDAGVVKIAWDNAYYNGKYYCYFGIVPVLLTYLPYYLLTGTMIENVTVILIFSILMVIGCFFLTYQMMKKWCRNIPFFAWPVISMLLCFAENYVFLYMRPEFYNVPILTANALTVWGLGIWMKGIQSEKGRWSWYFLGSLCMSLVAGSRPQMLLMSLLAVPLFWEEVICKRELFSKKGLRDTIAICLPYIVIGAGLMYYNYARFGSVFEFGATFNLTTNDMTRRGFNLDRLGGGLYTFFFQPPTYIGTFPYLQGSAISSRYMGKMIIEFMFGGIFITNIITWMNFSVVYMRDVLRKYKVLALVCMSLAMAFVLGSVDATIAGVLHRYTADMALVVLLPACIIMMVLLDYVAKDKGRAYHILSGFLIISFMALILFDFFMMFIYTGNGNINDTNKELYYLVDSYFRI